MFTDSKHSSKGLAAMLLAAAVLTGCASQAPALKGNAAFVLSGIEASGGAGTSGLADALETSGLATNGAAVPAYAEVNVTSVRYNSVFLGLFFGGPDYASMSVKLKTAAGQQLEQFSVNVGADADGAGADAALAKKAVAIIAARAANVYPAVTPKPKAMPVAKKPAPADEPIVISAPEPDVVALPAPDDDVPCVIGADGKCIPL
jgi:hypothetical protein